MKQTDLSTRDGIGLGLLELGKIRPDVVVLTADLAESTRVEDFARTYPSRFIEVGVAEQNMAGIAAGLALTNKIPVMASYAVFSPGLNWGVIRSAIAYSNLPVIIIGGHAGLATGPDGATHQALEDIALMRSLPNMTVIAPADAQEAEQALLAAVHHPGPTYIRTSKLPVPNVTRDAPRFEIGRATTLKQGSDATIIAHGTMVSRALQAAEALESDNISVQVINSSSIKPLDDVTILAAFRKTHAVISVEDHQRIGGLGSTIAELIAAQTVRAPFRALGVANQFGESGSAEALYQKHHLTSSDIQTTLKKLIRH